MRKRLATIAVVAVITTTALYSQESSSQSTSSSRSTQHSTPAGTSKTKPAGSASGAKASGSASSNPVQQKVSIKGWKTYCSEEGAYCISYPPDWNVVGDVFEGTGVVMAPPQSPKEKSQWDQVTSSVSYIPETEGDQDAPTFDDVLSSAMKQLPGNNVQTLQRTELVLAKRPAQLVKLQYDDPETKKTWVEEIVFIDDGDAIYSTALRAVPENLEKLEPIFRTIVATWRPSEEAPAVPAPSAPKKPAGTATPKPSAPTKVTPQ
jgi:hypothetical protein